MYNQNTILKSENFGELIGWREGNTNSSCYNELTSTLKRSSSCRFVNDLEAVSLGLVERIFNGDYESANEFLEVSRREAIISSLNHFVRHQKNNIKTKELLKNASIGIQVDNIRRFVNPRSRFVGYSIRPKMSGSVSATLFQLGLQFSSTVTDLPVYLYSTSCLDAIAVFYVTTTKSGMNWVTLANTTSGSGSNSGSSSSSSCSVEMPEVIASYISESNGTGDTYYLGYYEDDLVTQDVKAVATKSNCSSCGNNSSYKMINKYVEIKPIEVSSGLYQSREIFNVDQVGYTTETFGMNLKLNVKCDITSILVQNKLMFTDLVLYKNAMSVLWEAYNSKRLNSYQNTSKEDFRLMAEKYELDFKGCLKELELDFSALDKCLGSRDSNFKSLDL